jgi:hypothetical protein
MKTKKTLLQTRMPGAGAAPPRPSLTPMMVNQFAR